MPTRERLEQLALYGVLLLLAAYLVSAALGVLRRDRGSPPPAPSQLLRIPAVEASPEARGRVEVLNGSGRGGMARRATERLRAGGFDVVYFGNAGVQQDSSEVLDRVDRPEVARAVAELLAIRRVRTALDSTRLLDATVVLGRDWPRAEEVAASLRPGWRARLRAWLGAG